MLDRNHQAQLKLLDLIRDNHARLAALLAGASPGLLQRINGQFAGARRAIEESCSLVRLSQDSLRGYLRTIGAT
ncbi:hypothetical protein EF879_24380 [Micromonospora sp. HM5-17]|nr:hypothetical protein EF879_24380 [Micromonospora sp. HM5-17]